MMSFEWFIVAELCIITIVFIFEATSHKTKIKSQKNPEGNFDGRIVINTTDPNKDIFRIEYDGHVADIPTKEYLTFKVVREDL